MVSPLLGDRMSDQSTESLDRDRSSERPTSTVRILRCREVCAQTGLSRTTLWRLERQGQFPTRRVLTGNMVGWLSGEVEEWIVTRSSRPSARPWERVGSEPPLADGTQRKTRTSFERRNGRG